MVKSNTKPDQKGGIKPLKKGSTLASIMKLGGVGSAAGGKGPGREKQVKTQGIGNKGLSRKRNSEDVDMMDVEQGKITITDTKSMEGKGWSVITERTDATSNGDTENERKEKETEDEVMIVGVRSMNSKEYTSGYETMSTDATEQEIVNSWEKEIMELEHMLELAKTEKEKDEIKNKMGGAQVALKEALLRMSNHRKDFEYKVMAEGEEQINQEKAQDPMLAKRDDKKFDEDEDKPNSGGTQKEDTETETENKMIPEKVKEDLRWADMSDDDDDTVILGNQEGNKEIVKEWKVVGNKYAGKKGIDTTTNRGNTAESKDIRNPYATKHKTTQKNGGNIEPTPQNNQPSLVSYLETVKGKMRKENETSIRFTFSFTPRTTGSGEFIRVAKDLLLYAKQFDPDVLMLPWKEEEGNGPINIDDLANTKNMVEKIKHYFNKPGYVNIQQGTPAYGIGIRLSTNMAKMEFYNRWNIQKRSYKESNKVAYSISFAPLQKSASAYIIGIAVGSTENQDYELLNSKLEEETGIKGIEVSFQNINQAGVTQEFWDIANKKALNINRDKYSREHLQTKYQWAPNAIAIYVSSRDNINRARKIMLQKFGKSVNGRDPIWPDGSSMRFLPIKGGIIKSEKTKSIVRKRMAFHIWLKAHETSIEINVTNIHESIKAFKGKTLAEIILDYQDKEGARLFRHFNRVWSHDPSKEKWALSMHQNMVTEAQQVINNLKDDLHNKYGSSTEKFFVEADTGTKWRDVVRSRSQIEEDDDDWFDDEDDIDDMIKQGVVDSSFINFLTGNTENDDKQSVVSWGTGHTAYTEIVMAQDKTTGTVQSSITTDRSNLPAEERERRIDIVCARLRIKGVSEEEIEDITNNKDPFGLAFSGIHLQSWDADTEVILIMALRSQYLSTRKHDE